MGTIFLGIICFIAVIFAGTLFLIFLLMLIGFILWALKPVFWLIGCTYDKIAYSLTQGKKIKILPQNKPKKISRKNPNNDVVVEKDENNLFSLENINIDYEPSKTEKVYYEFGFLPINKEDLHNKKD